MTAKNQTGDPNLPRPGLRVLFAEDNPRDVTLTAALLERAGYALAFDAVDTPESFRARLKQADYEVIISDYNLRSWTAMEGLEIYKEIGKDIPFIVVSGSLGDEAATECIRRGATDFVLKDRMARLPAAINSALQATASRRKRVRAEEALRDSEEQYRLLFECHPHPMWVYDTETLAFLAVNDTAVLHYGYSREEYHKMKITDIRPAEDVSLLRDDAAKTNSLVQEGGLWRHRKKDGTVIYVEISSHSLPFGRGNSRLVLAHDVTERKKLEEHLHQSSKMEAIGQLAGGVAHDFNNLLTIITGYSDLVLEQMQPGSQFGGQIEEIRKAADRAAALTRQLLAFGRRQVLAPQVLNLNKIVANMDEMLRRLIGEDMDLVTKLDPTLGRTRVDPSQVEQVIMNLAVNSRDAMPEGGKLTIETANAEIDANYARRHAMAAPGSYVMLAVSDTGCGMDSETQSHIFEPFFTTKEVGKGTGLGLATVYGIVKQIGGEIWVYSEPGRGTTFKVYFPQVQDAEQTVEPPKVVSTSHRGSETIFVVEDEEAVRSLVRRVLGSNGYTVLAASNAEEAARICDQQEGTIDLLLTDVVMPGLSGRKLAHHLGFSRPKMKVLYMSGYSDNAIVHHGVLDPGTAFLQKPFTPDAVLRKVREVLDSP